jgi:ABC-type taurine transport system substrate-binding protein
MPNISCTFYLTRHHIQMSDITLVPTAPDQIFDTVNSGQVSAALTWNPHIRKIQKSLGDNAVSFYSDSLYTETYNLVARQDYANQHPDVIEKSFEPWLQPKRLSVNNQNRPNDCSVITLK